MIRKLPRNGSHAKVTFFLSDDGRSVTVVGDFNDWNPHTHQLKRRTNGTRSIAVELPTATTVRFRYLTQDGEFFDDPDADGVEPNGYGQTHSLLAV